MTRVDITSRLAVELLDQVHLAYVLPCKTDWLLLARARLLLSLVCKRWRDAVTANPHLWDAIFIHPWTSAAYTRSCLSKSKTVLLQLRIYTQRSERLVLRATGVRPEYRNVKCKTNAEFQEAVLRLMETVAARVQDVRYECNSNSALEQPCEAYQRHQWSRLASATIVGAQPAAFGQPFFACLTVLSLRCIIGGATVVDALRLATALTTLQLYEVQCGSVGESPIILPNVTDLHVQYSNDSCGTIALLLPGIRVLSVRVDGDVASIASLAAACPQVFSDAECVQLSMGMPTTEILAGVLHELQRTRFLDLQHCTDEVSPDFNPGCLLVGRSRQLLPLLDAVILPPDTPHWMVQRLLREQEARRCTVVTGGAVRAGTHTEWYLKAGVVRGRVFRHIEGSNAMMQ